MKHKKSIIDIEDFIFEIETELKNNLMHIKDGYLFDSRYYYEDDNICNLRFTYNVMLEERVCSWDINLHEFYRNKNYKEHYKGFTIIELTEQIENIYYFKKYIKFRQTSHYLNCDWEAIHKFLDNSQKIKFFSTNEFNEVIDQLDIKNLANDRGFVILSDNDLRYNEFIYFDNLENFICELIKKIELKDYHYSSFSSFVNKIADLTDDDIDELNELFKVMYKI